MTIHRNVRRALRPGMACVLAAILLASLGSPVSAQTAGEADMAILGVSDDPDPVTQNRAVTYDVGIGNFGPSRASGVGLTVELPPAVRFEPSMSSSNCSESGGTVSCSADFWDANAAGITTISATPTSPGLLQLTFEVTANEPDPNPMNNSDTETTQVNEATDADVSLRVGDAQGFAGQRICCLGVEVFNAGPADATGITVTLLFPPGLRPGEGAPGSCTADEGGATTCEVGFGSIPDRAGSSLLMEVRADAAGTYTVTGSVSADQPDPDTSNNADSGTVVVHPAADVSVRKTDSADPATPGQKLTYFVTVTNQGPSQATAVSLTDAWSSTVPGGVTLLSFTVSQGSCTQTGEATVGCQLGTLAGTATATLTIVLRPQGRGTVTNMASVSAAEFDPDTANNSASEETTVGKA
jgi:uncharacterized repeat protein (TIGR01451 family)